VNLLSAVSTAAAAGLLCATVRYGPEWPQRACWPRALWHQPAGLAHARHGRGFRAKRHVRGACPVPVLRIERAPARRPVFVLAFACGLAMGNHHTFVFIGAPVLLRSLWVARRELRPSGVVLAALGGALGLLPYPTSSSRRDRRPRSRGATRARLTASSGTFLRRDYGTLGLGKAGSNDAFSRERPFLRPSL